MVRKCLAGTWHFQWSFGGIGRKDIERFMSSVMIAQVSKRISPSAVLDPLQSWTCRYLSVLN